MDEAKEKCNCDNSIAALLEKKPSGHYKNGAGFYIIESYESLESTNQTLKEYAKNGAPEGLVVIAQHQTCGRGRMGRKFFSPKGTGIYMSILLRPYTFAGDTVYITTAAAVAVCEAIETVAPVKAEIKWVNDIMVSGKKVCGILTEAGGGAFHDHTGYIIIGIGLNMTTPQGGFPEEISTIAGSVFKSDDFDLQSRYELISEILEHLFCFYTIADKKSYMDEYKKRSMIIGKDIYVLRGNKKIRATALALDDECKLKVKFDSGSTEYLSSGEVSIRF